MSTFADYAAAGFGADLIPVIPPGATVSEQYSKLEESDVGKIPGKKTPSGWVGFAQWPKHEADAADHKRWTSWGAGLGLQGRNYPAADIDVDHKDLADAIELEATLALGFAPARFGRGERRLLVYSGAGFRKRRLAFTLPGGEDDVQAVEWLGQGQHYVVEGVHPKTGRPYQWRNDARPSAGGVAPVEPEELDEFLANVEFLVENLYDGVVTERSGGDARDASGGAGGAGGADSEPRSGAVARLLEQAPNTESYDGWTRVMVAAKAAGGEDAWDGFVDWSAKSGLHNEDLTRYKWDSFHPPYQIGWSWLASWAASHGVNSAAEEFDAVEGEQMTLGRAEGALQKGPKPTNPDAAILAEMGLADEEDDLVATMFERYAWVEGAKRAVHLETGELLDQEQFEFRIPPVGKKGSWAYFKEHPRKRISYKNLTFRPGGAPQVIEDLPDLEGLCLNIWREPKRALAATASDADIQPFLDLAASVIPHPAEREHVFDFMAFTAQQPGKKINHALVLGSRVEGVGKDTLFEPLRYVLGRRYVKEIGPQHLSKEFNSWIAGTKLAIVQEMHNFERIQTMNRLKPLVAAPPEALPVNIKHRTEFYVPNILSMVFFTNEDDALSLSKGDRRYFVTWHTDEPLAEGVYAAVWAWLKDGGSAKVGRWLLDRDVSRFNAKGRAPGTAAKDMMRRQSRAPLEEFIEDAIAERAHPFDRDLVLVDEAARAMPSYTHYKGSAPSPQKVSKVMARAGARAVTDKIRLDGIDGPRKIWAVRSIPTYAGEEPGTLRALFAKQRKSVEAANLRGEGGFFGGDPT